MSDRLGAAGLRMGAGIAAGRGDCCEGFFVGGLEPASVRQCAQSEAKDVLSDAGVDNVVSNQLRVAPRGAIGSVHAGGHP
jgi:hypothetical protein